MRKTNEAIEIAAASPLLRPGLTIRTRASKLYAADAAADLLEIARAINTSPTKAA